MRSPGNHTVVIESGDHEEEEETEDTYADIETTARGREGGESRAEEGTDLAVKKEEEVWLDLVFGWAVTITWEGVNSGERVMGT
jgi:hypothetical protein